MNKFVHYIAYNKSEQVRPIIKAIGAVPLLVGIIAIPAIPATGSNATKANSSISAQDTVKPGPKKSGLRLIGNHAQEMKNIQNYQKLVKDDKVVVFYNDGGVKLRTVKGVESTFDKAVITFKGGETDEKVKNIVKVYVGMNVTIVTPDEGGNNIPVSGRIIAMDEKDDGEIKMNAPEMGGDVAIAYRSIVSITNPYSKK